MQTRYRPYRWGNRIAVGVLLGQVLGMAHSPLAFPASVPEMVQTAMARVADADEPSDDPGVVEVEVRLGGASSILTPTTDLALAAGPEAGGSSTTGGQPADRPAATTALPTVTDTTSPGPGTTRRGGSGTTMGSGPTTTSGGAVSTNRSTTTAADDRSSTTRGPDDTPGGSTTTRPPTTRPPTTRPPTTVPTTGSTTTAPGSTTTTIDGDLPPGSGTEPCPLPADLVARWAVTVRDGDEQAVALRRDVVAAATAIPPEAFTLMGAATWQVQGPAGALCTASQLVEVVSVARLAD